MLKDQTALEFLAEQTDQPERSRSSYWEKELSNIELSADGSMRGYTPQGNVSRKTGIFHELAHWVLQIPIRAIGRRYEHFPECYRLGRAVARDQHRQYTGDMVRQSLALGLIRHYVSISEMSGANVVIGDGYGVMASLLSRVYPDNPVIVVNLRTPLLADLMFARAAISNKSLALPRNAKEMSEVLSESKFGLIGLMADDFELLNQVSVALAVNIHSMQEMPVSVVADYFRVLRAGPAQKTAFYCCNREFKKLGGGEELRFEHFPWQQEDTILVDEISPWDHIEYGPKPPFWRKNPNTMRHRLVYLKKEP